MAYDAIPVTSADMVPPTETSKFVRYLTAVKFASRMAGISAAATAEIAGFVQAVASQGLHGPLVTEIALPSEPLRHTDHPHRQPEHRPSWSSAATNHAKTTSRSCTARKSSGVKDFTSP